MTLFGVSVFEDVVKDHRMRAFGIRVGSKSNEESPYKRQKKNYTLKHNGRWRWILCLSLQKELTLSRPSFHASGLPDY